MLNVVMELKFHLKKLPFLTNNIILAMREPNTLRPLGISFRPFANSLRYTKYHKQCSDH